MRKAHLLIAFAVLFLDRLSKWGISQKIALHESINVIPGFFRLTHVQNRGAAVGRVSGSPCQ